MNSPREDKQILLHRHEKQKFILICNSTAHSIIHLNANDWKCSNNSIIMFPFLLCDCVCSAMWLFPLCLNREEMDKADVYWSVPDSCYGLWHSFLYQLHCYLLPRFQSHPIWHHGEFLTSFMHLFISHLNISLYNTNPFSRLMGQ